MMWARLDDTYCDHPKILRAWRRDRAAVGLHVMAITYCARHRTDGRVPGEWVEAVMPKATERRRTLDVLVDVGLFEPDGDDFLVHDFLDYHGSREETATRQAEISRVRSEAGKRGAVARWHREANADGKPMANRWQVANGKNGSLPDPTLNTSFAMSSHGSDEEGKTGEVQPLHPDAGVAVDGTPPPRSAAPPSPDVQRLCVLLASLVLENDPGARVPDPQRPFPKAWVDPMRLLVERDGRPPGEVERVVRWCQADEFWRTTVLSPAKLRKQFTQLKLRMEASGLRRAVENGRPPSSAQLGAALSRAARTGVRKDA